MGLDITAFSNATPDNSEDAYHVYVTDRVPNLLDGKAEGRYSGENYFSFRAGSYSGYNEWRAWLSRTSLQAEPDSVWERPEKFEGMPFLELINFSDCEGAMGPQTCAKLHKDFRDHEAELAAKLLRGEDDWKMKLYRSWMKAFSIGALEGFVIFH